MSTMLGRRPQEPLSCLNRRMGHQRDAIELRIWKDIAGCSWHETSRPPAASQDAPAAERRVGGQTASGGTIWFSSRSTHPRLMDQLYEEHVIENTDRHERGSNREEEHRQRQMRVEDAAA